MQKQNGIWISFDLGVQGDYEGIYRWLDEKSAIECGDSLAFLNYKYSGDLLKKLQADFKSAISVDKKTRIYVIRLENGKMKGKFIFGSRRQPAWTGMAGGNGQEEDDNA